MTTPQREGTYKGKTAAQWRADAQAALDEANRNTGDHKSLWEAELTARHADLCAELAQSNGLVEVEGLFDLRGRLLDAYHGWGKYGDWWMLLHPSGVKTGEFFTPSRAKTDEVAIRSNAKKGYYIGLVMVPGKATIISATGSSGAASCYAAIVPIDDNVTHNTVVKIVDNGQ